MPTFTTSASLAELVTHIQTNHHARLRTDLKRLARLTAEAISKAGPHQAALQQSAALLARFTAEMLPHLDHEELVVFPLILAIERGGPEAESAYRQLAAQVADLEAAHTETGAELDELHRICDMVPAPTDAEPLLAELLDAYAEVITDTHRHVALENEVLMPRALALASAKRA